MWGVLGNNKQKLIEKLVVSREAPLVVERKPWGHHSPGLSLLHPFGDGSAMSGSCKGSIRSTSMKLDLAQAQPMGSLIIEGTHRPFHALACALRPAAVRIGRKISAP